METPLEESEVADMLYNEMQMLFETGRSDLGCLHFFGKFLATNIDRVQKYVVRFSHLELSRLTVFVSKRDEAAQFLTVVDTEAPDDVTDHFIFKFSTYPS